MTTEKKRKKISFLHLGESRIAAKAVAKELGFEFVDVPKTNKSTIKKGLLVSSEFSCFPFKSTLGVFIEAADIGAELLCIPCATDIGACQFSDFAMAQKYILEKHGYKAEILGLNVFKPKRSYEALKKHNPELTFKKFSESMFLFSQKFLILEDIKEYYNQIYVSVSKKEADKFKIKYQKEVDKAYTIMELYNLRNKVKEKFLEYPRVDYKDKIKIGIVGDIYVINDDYLNNNIFERIFDLGAYAENGISPSTLYSGKFGINTDEIFGKDKWEKYLKHDIGGYAMHTLKQTIKFAEEGYDGVIHIYPFNCMPETAIRSILPKVGTDYNIPILYLPIDELTGDAGFATRLEAFVDLLTIKKRKQLK